MNSREQMDRSFMTEYTSDAAIQKYSSKTAGRGISYLLDHAYGSIYTKAIKQQLKTPVGDGLRILEFGCGAGMNLIHSAARFDEEGTPIAAAYGTDFSDVLIREAQREALALPARLRSRTQFVVARSEILIPQLAAGLGVKPSELHNSFHLILGVNAFRYCVRQSNAEICAKAIFELLKPGGVCVNIDMNNRFPAFRSFLRDRLTKPKAEYYVPTLAEYTAPFAAVGFEVLESRNFCWVPHSAGSGLLAVCKALTPVLDAVVPSFAMRSLVVSRKPLQ
jgi:SAM-dependent methyltransferase